ncbi:PEF-CTERM protein sorting domain-containing protein [Methanolobus vulcani]|jgi:hypothetical protein|uniref:PEF-CTERM protein sorting domain-containing protein n=1 Tax=Methanolobus vulcani TaxID=38026 RepID=A0A7Z7B0R1_9EURY|nr:PEF-CTERM sorting domain-containing protein [Methanolobus vulcani]SDF56671.1 PEF-CTERM protein sorting domain-containing protein [Methanolobus vulcani]
MRKLSIMIILVALLLSMTQAASAQTELEDGCYCVNLVGEYQIVPQVASAPIQQVAPTSFHLDVYAKVCKSGTVITVQEFKDINSGPGVVLDTCMVTMLDENTIELFANGTCMGGNYFEGNMVLTKSNGNYITLPAAPATGTVYTVNMEIPVTGCFTATIKPCPEEIPEFPTIAIPVAAIIGLAFFMQRRKE